MNNIRTRDFVGTWEVEVKAGKEEDSIEYDVDIAESTGKSKFTSIVQCMCSNQVYNF